MAGRDMMAADIQTSDDRRTASHPVADEPAAAAATPGTDDAVAREASEAAPRESRRRSGRRTDADRRRPATRRPPARFTRVLGTYVFSSLTRRIVILNLAGLIALVSGILFLNQFRAGLIDARVESLLTQSEIIATAIAASASADEGGVLLDPDQLLRAQANEAAPPSPDDGLGALDFPINPERVAPVLRRLISPTKTRARIYDRDGVLLLDSRHLYARGQILRFDAPAPAAPKDDLFSQVWTTVERWLGTEDLPVYKDLGPAGGRGYPEVEQALDGAPATVVRSNERNEVVIAVAVPIQRQRTVLGALLLSTQGGDIEQILHAERMAIVRVFLVAAGVMVVLSVLLAGTIAGPMRRLAAAADRVRRGVKAREAIPDFPERNDEIGHLARALKEMTSALYRRMDAIEAFAADVSHELKNPLTSLKSAVETLPRAKSDESKARLYAVIEHDVRRLNRLISDISDASRLDAELSREDTEPVDMARLLATVVDVQRGLVRSGGPKLALTVASAKPNAYFTLGHDSRIGQVFTNLIDNARSFSPPEGTVRVAMRRDGDDIEVLVEDEGPGIRPDQMERIFERFYTDRPERDGFGNNSGLGLSISKQIVEAHRGSIIAENRTADTSRAELPGGETAVLGARFVVRLPAAV
jgi:two-component system sensor histidine kinase ChvG